MSKVSVVVPVYNAQQYLSETLICLQRQTLKNIEILCIDDGSEDESLEILRTAARKDPRIRVIEKENGGVGTARNAGLEFASGDYVSFIDSDDFVSQDYLEQLCANLSPDRPDIVVTGNVMDYWPDDSKSSRYVGVTGEALLTTPLEKAPLVTSTGLTQNKLYRTAFIRENSIQHYSGKSVSEDNYFTICSLALSRSVKTFLGGTYLYRQHSNSMTKARKTPDDKSIFDVYDRARSFVIPSFNDSRVASQWDAIITQRQKIDLTNYHFELDPPERAGFRAHVSHMTQGKIHIPKPEKERLDIIRFHLAAITTQKLVCKVGLHHLLGRSG